MIDIKNSSTEHLQRSSGTLNNISMIFGMIFLSFLRLPSVLSFFFVACVCVFPFSVKFQ
jgi:hypothetical protein